MRRMALSAVLVGLVLSVSGCLPANRVGFAKAEDGQVLILNCGAYIHRVEILSPGADTPLWSTTPSPEERDVAQLALGAPPSGWDSTGQVPEPLFVGTLAVETSLTDPPEITSMPVSSLEPGRVVTGNQTIAIGSWNDSCHALFWGTPGWVTALGFALATAVGVGLVVVLIRHSRRPRRAPPSIA